MLFNKKRALEIMTEKGIDAIISSSAANNTYLSDFPIQGFCIFTSNGEAAVIARAVAELLFAGEKTWIDEVQYYGKFAMIPSVSRSLSKIESKVNDSILGKSLKHSENDAVQLLSSVLKQKGLFNGKTVGIDGRGLVFEEFHRLQRELYNTKFVEASDIFSFIRAVKTEEEINRVKQATKIIEAGFSDAAKSAHEGSTESEIARGFRKSIVSDQNVEVSWYAFLAGSRSALSLAPPSDYKLKRGDFVVLHSNLSYKYYHSDIARGGTVGKPSEKQQTIWNAVVSGEEKIIDSVAPGVRADELFKIGVEQVQKNGAPDFARHHVGHGIGLGWGGVEYDHPVLAPWCKMELLENMILCIETPYNKIGFAGMVFEDIGLVTNKGFRSFSKHDPKLMRF